VPNNRYGGFEQSPEKHVVKLSSTKHQSAAPMRANGSIDTIQTDDLEINGDSTYKDESTPFKKPSPSQLPYNPFVDH
jgi:hypothetical protein